MTATADFAAYLQQLSPEQLQDALAQFLPSTSSAAERTAVVDAALRSAQGKKLRVELGRWIVDRLVPVASLLPQRYALWREPTRESMLFVITHLSTERLAPKLIEQLDLPRNTSPEARLLALITRVPGLQKLGQVLARNRHLRHSVRKALSKLENGIRDVGIDDVVALIYAELGSKREEHQVAVEHKLLSEASVSAVVRFTWWNPERKRREKGVFKVLKPHIPSCFQEDMKILQSLADFFGRRTYEGFAANVIPDTFSKIRRHLQREVDFPGEQRALVEAAKQFRALRGVRIPKLIPELSTAKLTAMSEESGVKVTSAATRLSSPHRKRLAQGMVEALIAFPVLSRQPVAMFHADPHAGNLLYDARSRNLVLLDWALAEHLTREQRRHLMLLFLGVALRNPAAATLQIVQLSEDKKHYAQVRSIVERFFDELPLTRLPRAVDAMSLLEQAARAGVAFPSSLIMFSKVLFTLDGILDDILGSGTLPELTIARYQVARWIRQPLSTGLPFTLRDWIGIECSALLYGGRIGVRCEQEIVRKVFGSHAESGHSVASAGLM